jgi:hypothetical protein
MVIFEYLTVEHIVTYDLNNSDINESQFENVLE